MQSKQGPAGAVEGVVLSPEFKIRRDQQNKCTKLHICPMNVEAFQRKEEFKTGVMPAQDLASLRIRFDLNDLPNLPVALLVCLSES